MAYWSCSHELSDLIYKNVGLECCNEQYNIIYEAWF